ncbi:MULTISPECIES: hypothetical protein [Peribacillus]|uniref:hypothetical protein n=1 Tax=Peribacillus TaxID=2675229 RepID=UPI00330562BA
MNEITKREPCIKGVPFRLLENLLSEIHSLSHCQTSLIKASVCGVSVSQLFGRSVANFLNPVRIAVKNLKDKDLF